VKTEKVEVSIFDVSGRRVKKLADRVFEGGKNHDLRWDGTNEEGRSVARGVYFYQLRSPSFTSQKKLTVLRD
jgi:flagellar hook assembly protein FlgD